MRLLNLRDVVCLFRFITSRGSSQTRRPWKMKRPTTTFWNLTARFVFFSQTLYTVAFLTCERLSVCGDVTCLQRYPYDLGNWKENAQVFLGPDPLLWFLPIDNVSREDSLGEFPGSALVRVSVTLIPLHPSHRPLQLEMRSRTTTSCEESTIIECVRYLVSREGGSSHLSCSCLFIE